MGVLFSLKPRVLQIEHDWFAIRPTFQSSVHLLSVLEAPHVIVGGGRTPHFVITWGPFGVREVLEVVIHLQILGRG